ncbi:hypothetical protein [Flammeovirga sp. SJP92]|uniref:hypothetical protein n=1 Tax=Flammeovirga sp. SJP92 TaxID=1775430 RepID=UPI0007997E8A|nr:hypothetical protein [Flammeovirga sp. SJP92]KXX71397.1 hypothetical protein AVL50_05710 [Flammeovirga sp. SJP92]
MRNTITILLLLLSFDSFAQDDWRAGYIIEKSGKKVYGQIDYRASRFNSAQCDFRTNEQSIEKRYLPGEIEGYRFVDGKYYISSSLELKGEEEQVFLEVLISGAVNIYFYKGAKGRYYIQKEGELHELKNTEKVVDNGKITYRKELKEYIHLMNYLLADAKMVHQVNNLKYSHDSFIKIAKTYHDKVCFDQECIIYEKKQTPLKINFGVTGGRLGQTLLLDEDGTHNYQSSPSYFIGEAVNIQNIPGIYERFSIQAEILVSEYHIGEEKKYQLHFPILFDYRLIPTKLYPKVEAGFSTYFIENGQNIESRSTLIGGVSLNYEYYKKSRAFINVRTDGNGVFRLGGGVLF